MTKITDIKRLEEIYDAKHPLSLSKELDHISPLYREWIEKSRFVIVSTVGPEGTDASPRGDDGAVARVADAKTLLIPDWRGNNRLDTLRNIVRDPRVSLLFMTPVSQIVVRVNGSAEVVEDEKLAASFLKNDITPRTVIIVKAERVYFQCPKAIMRSGLFKGENLGDVPSAGDFLRDAEGDFDGTAFDAGYAEYAKTRMW